MSFSFPWQVVLKLGDLICFHCKIYTCGSYSLGVDRLKAGESTWVKPGVHRSIEVAGSQALKMDGVPLRMEAGKAFQTKRTAPGKKWEGRQCREPRWRARVERPQGKRRQWGRGHGPGQPGSLVERSQAARSRGNLGSLQLEVRLRDEMVLPSGCYQPLVQLLCREVKLGTQVRGPLGEGGRVQGQ